MPGAAGEVFFEKWGGIQTAGRENLGDLAPKFAELNYDVLFGEVWLRIFSKWISGNT